MAATSCRTTRSACWRRRAIYGRRKDMFRRGIPRRAARSWRRATSRSPTCAAPGAARWGSRNSCRRNSTSTRVDFDGDGHRDIWSSVPDALASAAQQLVNKGWKRGQRWAYEVRAPASVDCTIGVPEFKQPVREWLQRGFAPTHGRKPSPNEFDEPASLLQPEGHLRSGVPDAQQLLRDQGIQFLRSLRAVRRAPERPHRRSAAVRDAVEQEHAAARARRSRSMQNTLTKLGLYKDKIDGKAGMLTRSALGALSEGQPPQGRLLADRRGARAHAVRERSASD